MFENGMSCQIGTGSLIHTHMHTLISKGSQNWPVLSHGTQTCPTVVSAPVPASHAHAGV